MLINRALIFECAVASVLLGIGGLVTIAFAMWLAGAEVSLMQNLKAGFYLCFTRFAGLYIVRMGFLKWVKQ
jgi:hypothetical protein